MQDMGDIKKALHIKFSGRLLSKNNMWTQFFKTKYIKGDHLICSKPIPMGSAFKNAIHKVIMRYTCIHEWNVHFGLINGLTLAL